MFSLKINDRFRNRKIDFFNEFTLELRHDSISSGFGFSFYFDPNNYEHKELACVTHFHEVQVLYNDELLVTGVITSQKFRHTPTKSLCVITGYTKTGVLEDCQIPPQLYPLQSNRLSLREITEKLLKPFKLDLVIDSSVSSAANKIIDISTANETQTIKDYLVELAKQRDILVSHNEKGQLLFTSLKTDITPLIEFDNTKGIQVGTSFELNYDGQGMHSHITTQKQASVDGGNAGEQTIRNPYVLSSYYRPKVTTQSSGDDNDTQSAAERELASELKGLTLTIDTDRWVIDGKIIRPNNIITIFDPELYIYKKTTWFIESIRYTGNETENIATINCVVPEVYNKKKPTSIFAGINLHA
jgi:prophage tail gpP-like protein